MTSDENKNNKLVSACFLTLLLPIILLASMLHSSWPHDFPHIFEPVLQFGPVLCDTFYPPPTLLKKNPQKTSTVLKLPVQLFANFFFSFTDTMRDWDYLTQSVEMMPKSPFYD